MTMLYFLKADKLKLILMLFSGLLLSSGVADACIPKMYMYQDISFSDFLNNAAAASLAIVLFKSIIYRQARQLKLFSIIFAANMMAIIFVAYVFSLQWTQDHIGLGSWQLGTFFEAINPRNPQRYGIIYGVIISVVLGLAIIEWWLISKSVDKIHDRTKVAIVLLNFIHAISLIMIISGRTSLTTC